MWVAQNYAATVEYYIIFARCSPVFSSFSMLFLSFDFFFHSLFCIVFFRAFLVSLFRVLCVSVCFILLRVFNLPGCALSFLICFIKHDFVVVIFCCMRLGYALLQGLHLATPQATPEVSCQSGLVCRSFILGLVPFFCVLRWPLLYKTCGCCGDSIHKVLCGNLPPSRTYAAWEIWGLCAFCVSGRFSLQL